jgi:hypothetical protein
MRWEADVVHGALLHFMLIFRKSVETAVGVRLPTFTRKILLIVVHFHFDFSSFKARLNVPQ